MANPKRTLKPECRGCGATFDVDELPVRLACRALRDAGWSVHALAADERYGKRRRRGVQGRTGRARYQFACPDCKARLRRESYATRIKHCGLCGSPDHNARTCNRTEQA